MKIITMFAAGGLMAAGLAVCASDGAKRAAVLVELFTSEGCSSCPPADVLLESLDRAQPVEGAEIVVLSEHVDYWNQIGWTDPFSSSRYSQRQQAYARRFRLDGGYTPQMVVDGTTEFVGSDGRRAIADIGKAARTAKAAVRILPTEDRSRVRIEVEGAANAEVFLAVALNEAVSQVMRGENKGRKLTHVAVVQSLTQIGKVAANGSFSREIELPADKKADPKGYRYAAFVQERGQGRILGTALLKP
ncbi:MAG: DUF1223 domain-containing protein [Bryobacteraceae bacterium]